jgi:hypothetical protein
MACCGVKLLYLTEYNSSLYNWQLSLGFKAVKIIYIVYQRHEMSLGAEMQQYSWLHDGAEE